MIAGTLAWMAGLISLQFFSELPSLLWLWLSPITLLSLRFTGFRPAALFLLGMAWALIDAYGTLDETLPLYLENQDVRVVGTLEDLPEDNGERLRFLYRIESLEADGRSYPAPGLVRLSWYGAHRELSSGERWQLLVRLKSPRGFSNPGGFDYEGWLYRNAIRATGYVRSHPENQRLEPSSRVPKVDTIREALRDRQQSALQGNPFSGLIRAVTLGDRSAVSDGQWQVLRRTGTTHLLAISGLHIGLLAGMAFVIVRVAWSALPGLTQRIAATRAAGCIALLVATAYAALAGFSLPTQRALIMVWVFMLGLILARTQRPLRSLVIALGVVTLYDPKSVLSPGFWLSFGAVAIILYAMLGRQRQAGGWEWLRIQWVVALGLSPLLIGFFGQTSVVAPMANLVAIPWIGFAVIPAALLGTVLVVASPSGGEMVLAIAAWLLQGIWQLLERVDGLPFSSWVTPEIPWYLVVVALLGVGLILAPRGVPLRWLGVVLLVPLAGYSHDTSPVQGAFRLTLLDVGQGLAAVIQTHSHTLLYDTGPRFSERFDTGEAVVVPFLRSRGVGHVDRLVISHSDNDHAGGADSVRRLVAVDSERRAPRPGELLNPGHCVAGEQWRWDDVLFTVLHPSHPYESESEENDHSCVLRISSGRYAVLLTGDIEREGERTLLRQAGDSLRADLLVVPHHGSASSSSLELLQQVKPRLALVGSGYKNRWSFPRKTVLRRYQSLKIPVMSTADWGAIEVVIDSRSGLSSPEAWRAKKRRYWHGAFGGEAKSSNIAPLISSDSAEDRAH